MVTSDHVVDHVVDHVLMTLSSRCRRMRFLNEAAFVRSIHCVFTMCIVAILLMKDTGE